MAPWRWILPWLFALLLGVIGHAWIVDAHVRRASSLSREGMRISLPYQQIRPEFTIDGNMWIRYAVRLAEGEGPQLRTSMIDNAPRGREVHWNSGYAWWIAAWGWGWQKITGLPLTLATERAAIWLNAPLLLGFSLLFAGWTARCWGWKIGLFVGTCLVAPQTIYEGFWPGYTDHHGLAFASILGLGLGAAMMRGGWLASGEAEAEKRAVAAARWSGFFGAAGLWISAATTIPLIALVALSALVACRLERRSLRQSTVFFPSVWRAWGLTGAATSAGFYGLEYFPFHLGWRLEVNHPLHSLAWLAGAFLVARLMPLVVGKAERGARRRLAFTALWALPLALAPAAAVAVWRTQVFVPLDPFMAGLHATIIEFLPLADRLRLDGFWSHANTLLILPAAYVLGLLVLRVRGADRWLIIFAIGLALPLHALGFYQSRWATNATVGQVLLFVGVLLALPQVRGLAVRRGRLIAAAAGIAGLFFGPSLFFRGAESFLLAQALGTTPSDVRQLIYREVAQVIRASQPTGDVVLFGSPNTSVNVAFYGDFQTLGTLYWENLEGLKAAAEISSAQTDEEAARLIRERGVTHLAFFRDGNYIFEYAQLLRPDITPEETQQTFGYRLLGARQVPVWLEALPYATPAGLPDSIDREVLVFKVNFDQTPSMAAYHIGVLQTRRQETTDALNSFALAFDLDRTNYPALLRLGELEAERGNWDAAQASFDLATRVAPPGERYRLLTQTGIGFAARGQLARAAAAYERALREQVTNAIAANNLAWLYATAADETLRRPARALELARSCVAAEPANPAYLGTLAAAEAAAGDFPAAIATLTRAMDFVRQLGTLHLLPPMEERLATYRQERNWVAP